MNKALNQWLHFIRQDMRIFLWTSLGVFLFILFFQPLPLEGFDFNNRLLLVAGLGGIVFVMMLGLRTIFPPLSNHEASLSNQQQFPAFLSSLILLIMLSVAFAFYLRYVGGVTITFFIMFKVVFICLVPAVVIKLCDSFRALKSKNEALYSSYQTSQMELEKFKEEYFNKPIIFTSDNSTDKLSLMISDVVLIKSADNYVEVVYKEGNNFARKLLRNTLKNIDKQLQPYSSFIRCHRICIINKHHIHSLESRNQNHWITILGYDEQIPVSRQYLIKVKESL